MRSLLVMSTVALMSVITFSPLLRAQTVAPPAAAMARSQNSSSRMADLSGDWGLDGKRGGIGQSISLSDPQGKLRGKEPDISYQPWALEKTLSEKPSTGPDSVWEVTTDPTVRYCDPQGPTRIYMWPARTRFVQTPEYVYILHEVGPFVRVVRMNSKHLEDPDPQWWGDSIGWYENGDTLVVDTIGLNGKFWLDQVGHPTTEKMHLTERYRRVDKDILELDQTVDDPGAYTKPIASHRNFKIASLPFMTYQWACSTLENQRFHDNLAAPAVTSPSSK